jgi:hypothetical protein
MPDYKDYKKIIEVSPMKYTRSHLFHYYVIQGTDSFGCHKKQETIQKHSKKSVPSFWSTVIGFFSQCYFFNNINLQCQQVQSDGNNVGFKETISPTSSSVLNILQWGHQIWGVVGSCHLQSNSTPNGLICMEGST